VAHKGIRELIRIQQKLLPEVSVPKMEWKPLEVPGEVCRRVEELARNRSAESLNLREKAERNQALAALSEDVMAALAEELPGQEQAVAAVLSEIEKETMRRQILERGERADGRRPDEIPPITCEVGLLPRTHGSALFTRGQTQALAVVTLGTTADEQRIDSIDVPQEVSKSFMLHYN